MALATAAVLSFLGGAADAVLLALVLLTTAGITIVVFVGSRRAVLATLDAGRQEARRQHEALAELERDAEVGRRAIAASKGGWWEVALDPRAAHRMPARSLLSAALGEALGGSAELERWETWRGRIHPGDFRRIESAAQSHLEGDTAYFEACYRIRTSGGDWRWVEVRGAVERDREGLPVRWSGLDWDVTERELAGRRFEHFRQIAVSSPNPILITDAHGMIEYVNPSFVRVTGYGEDDVLGRSPLMFDSEATPDETHEEAWATITAGHDWQGEFENRHKNGERYRVSVSISPIRDETGAISHFLLIHQRAAQVEDADLEGSAGLRSFGPY